MLSEKVRIRILVPLWGADYYDRWFELPAASLQSPGNIPYLQARAEVELVFLTKSQDLAFLHTHAVFLALSARMRVRTITIDEFFPRGEKVPYGVPLTLAYAKGVQDLGDDGIGTFVILINADFVLSDRSLANVFSRIEQGFHIITAPSLRAVDHEARPLLSQLLISQKKGSGLPSRAMVRVAEQCMHQTVLARIINQPQLVEAWYYHLIYWRISANCLAARYFLLMPLCFQLRRHLKAVTCPVDYGFLEQLCPGGRYTVMCDSDEFFMLELQHRDSEANLLEIARKFRSPAEALDNKIANIVLNASDWSIREHRRAAMHTLLFHSEDLPADIDDKLAEFDANMDRMLAELPPPVPAYRHYHWLGALQGYRAAYAKDGLDTCPMLLLDDANRIQIDLFEMTAGEQACMSSRWPAPKASYLADLADYLRDASAIIALDELVGDLAGIAPSARIFPAMQAEAHSYDMQVDFNLPEDFKLDGNGVLAIYLLTDSIPHCPKFRRIFDSVIKADGEVLFLFRTPNWGDVRLEDNTWILSLFQYLFRADLYSVDIKAIPLAGSATSPARPAMVHDTVLPTHEPPHDMGTADADERVATSLTPLPNTMTHMGFAIRLSAPSSRGEIGDRRLQDASH